MTDSRDEKIALLEQEIYSLQTELKESKQEIERLERSIYSKHLAYLELEAELYKIQQQKDLIHNARGAGRKVDYDKRAKQREEFGMLYEDGYSEKQIMSIMGISRSSYFRIKKRYKTHKQFAKEYYKQENE